MTKRAGAKIIVPALFYALRLIRGCTRTPSIQMATLPAATRLDVSATNRRTARVSTVFPDQSELETPFSLVAVTLPPRFGTRRSSSIAG
jgi:hypothetical protein